MKNIIPKHARWPHVNDPIFNISGLAKKAIQEKGAEKVINSTLGSLMDDSGKLLVFDTVIDSLKSLDQQFIASYAPISGRVDYLDRVIDLCFGPYKPKAYIKAVASPGGTGAVRNAIWNFTNPNDTVLCHDWFWNPYQTMCDEFGRNLVTYKLFDDNYNFNFEDFKDKFLNCVEEKDRILVIFNSPGNNPTGFSISDEDWDRILSLVKKAAQDENTAITLLLDVAYIEFAGFNDEQKAFFSKFENLPENVFIAVAFSMSKSYTAYGLRAGALIGLSSSPEIIEDFYYAASHSARSNWSNINHSAMKVLVDLFDDPEKSKAYQKELDASKQLLHQRAQVFVASAEEVGLDILPYFGGFFISIPCENSAQIVEDLMQDDLYMVGLKKGLRFAVCAVNEKKCRLAPKLIKAALDRHK
ncbi:aminotransferase class I/II-fold pyridoxal phosphate-dependent enzyme [Atopobacter sp. AH10]|uniref:pyridoxal phosphate-dependent aminotransferase n=1 Tax=Atopobacter sp. AH10 TaxID=2315861 RepID=UPI000EF196A9|nr:aminotransferase class I/II-fold pyridoxal phosphate-dependent enzyme [Atopobacter sp. AH10]RLK63045.1 aminotransferase class I/II-fold pyridoxal phosphate-dependent enzyme [Atopobacter sp. AH10]